jgi:hypothetical protein
MAHSTLPSLTHPSFPQVFEAATAQLVDRLTVPQISICCYESPESRWGACDGGIPCNQPAVVVDVATELEYCARHARKVGL